MPTPTTQFDVQDLEQHRVQMWFQNPANASQGGWVTVPRLFCKTARLALPSSGGMSTLNLDYDYGKVDVLDGQGWIDEPPLGQPGSKIAGLNPYGAGPMDEIYHRFVRVQALNSSALWNTLHCGVITKSVDTQFKQSHSPETDGDSVLRYGTQTITAVGPEWILNRYQVVTSIAHNDSGNYTVKRGLPFNMRGSVGRSIVGNRDLTFSLFGGEEEDDAIWSGEDIANYLNSQSFPNRLDVDNVAPFVSPTFTWVITNASKLASLRPQIDTHGKSLYQIVSELANQRRFLNWYVRYVAGASDAVFGTFELIYDTASSGVISIPDGSNIPANTNTVSLPVSGFIGASLSLNVDAKDEFSQVKVEGARKGHIITTQVHVGNFLKQGWSTEDNTAYIEGAEPDHAGWASYAQTRKETLNAIVRTTLYPEVYTRFVCPADADFAGITSNPLYVRDLRWQRKMPLKEGWDYSITTPVAKAGARKYPEFRDIFSIYEVDSKNSTEIPTVFADGRSLSKVMRDEGYDKASSVRIRPLDDAFGVSLRPATVQPHWQASGVEIDTPDPSHGQPFDWKADIAITGYFQEDERASAIYPATFTSVSNAAAVHTIRLGEVAFYDTLHANTVVEVDTSGQKVTSPGSDVVVRNDLDVLKATARLAYEWYASRRFGYTVGYSHYVHDVRPGVMATDIDGASSTSSIISEVTYNFEKGTTIITTSYAKPDFRLIARGALNVT